jgi:pSer/pThr/pTyr-binding forkhead associated (FHA) protein
MDEEPAEELSADPALAEPVAAEEPLAEDAPEGWATSTDPTARPFGATPETSPIDLQDPSPEPLSWEEPGGGNAPAEVPLDEAAVVEAFEDAPAAIADPLEDAPAPAAEPEPPYQASLVVERGTAAGTTYLLGHIENVVGGAGAAIELPDDPHLAPRHAAIVFDEQRLLLRDEGSANGVYVKVRESAAIEPGDCFAAGERLLRFDGHCELPVGEPGETPYLGSPRPQGTVVRVTEILRGGKTGRTCFRAGPAIAVGRTGCDLNFASDPQLAPRHAEVRIAPDGSATLVDLDASPGGVFLRLRPQQSLELQAGDLIQLGDQLLRLEVA